MQKTRLQPSRTFSHLQPLLQGAVHRQAHSQSLRRGNLYVLMCQSRSQRVHAPLTQW
jgi:hypothetical protein